MRNALSLFPDAAVADWIRIFGMPPECCVLHITHAAIFVFRQYLCSNYPLVVAIHGRGVGVQEYDEAL
jgi:hypothetical protein